LALEPLECQIFDRPQAMACGHQERP
jgi:hypothetical protein